MESTKGKIIPIDLDFEYVKLFETGYGMETHNNRKIYLKLNDMILDNYLVMLIRVLTYIKIIESGNPDLILKYDNVQEDINIMIKDKASSSYPKGCKGRGAEIENKIYEWLPGIDSELYHALETIETDKDYKTSIKRPAIRIGSSKAFVGYRIFTIYRNLRESFKKSIEKYGNEVYDIKSSSGAKTKLLVFGKRYNYCVNTIVNKK